MFCRSVSWFIFIFVAVLTAADYSDSHPSAGFDPVLTVYHFGTDNQESPTSGQVQEVKEAAAVDLGTLLDAGDSAVVTLVAGDTRLAAHRAVLAARSPVFAAVFSHGTLEAAVPDVGGPLLRHLVAYMYTLQAPQLARMDPQLLVAADKYGLSGLKAQCEQQLAAQLSVETAVATAVLAIRNSYSTLKKAAAAFIKTHIMYVMATKGWADALHCQPEDLIEVLKLLSEPPAETSTPATGDNEVTPTSQLHMGHKNCSRAPVPAAKHTATCPTPTFDDASVSFLRTLSAAEKGRRLMKAASDGAVQELQMLLAAGADVGATDGNKNTALHWAAWQGHVEAASCLVGAGAEVDAGNWVQNTPLHWAAWGGRPAVVRLLEEASADPNARNVDGDTPLHFAAEHGRTEEAIALLDAGADSGARNHKGKTPVDRARQFNHQHWVDRIRRG
ncbi:ankyrin-3-like isoform X1 [Schistocerca nitens]|uniref:ankyrin-3-like isoform X1 n=1 Tax=Schistocerca nitens TaxID=7011 RepID=UPI002118F64C|nr:ankyrin-3-like isoform X1 [Schistocerca nitens]XP_049798413.1 ankyrin-3-like isoform X1 [Schistocerca nitens]